ncbi:carbohydrate esterase family 4 protein [Lentinula edodes]|uniref:carbohydrate esterase family 4 protein n=1 Tax=Lentinula edodes TaxID=5353 RepID=UPI001E8D5BD1|nr:carbohydrate esterase family 4 protein [Lentinula edodes]KAH7872106.1 carbohydrate esterase family 4 protein [Lentinula edodes]KAJ3904554.1 carbohydrate esterase family 4 protein [Lentinula edodes]
MQSLSVYRLHKLLVVVGLLHVRVNAQTSTADRTTETGEAAITDPNEECSPYSYPPVVNQLSAFPSIWEAASILSDDSAAQAKWDSISANIPSNISVKTQPPASNYSSDDPDCWWTYSLCTEPKLSGLPVDISAAPEPSTLGYGFDDGPNCSHNAFYDFLLNQNQKATFYYIGSNVADWPLEAQRALADGHEICAHTWSHPYMTTFSSEAAFAELWYSMQMIKLAVGVTPTCWRPPYGDVDDRIRSIAHALGLQTIMWGYDSEDADINGQSITDQTVVTNYNNFITTASNGTFNFTGAIILTHELNNFTMSEAVQFYPQLKSSFQHIVPVGVSLNKTQPYVETNYSLPTFEQYIAGAVSVNGTRVSPNSTSSFQSESSTSSISSSSTPPATTSASNAANRVAIYRGFLLLMFFGLIRYPL